jgi:hypothetical protein
MTSKGKVLFVKPKSKRRELHAELADPWKTLREKPGVTVRSEGSV